MSVPGSARRPEWLRIRLRTTGAFAEVREMMGGLGLVTVCEEARCPNIYECWGHRTATFMILGDVCTRRCGFCAVTSGLPSGPPDPDEPSRVAEAVARLGLAHAVITSVDRDDLADGGAGHFARVVRAIRERVAGCAVEVLTPDFKGASGALDTVLSARPEVFSHNIETVRRLYRKARPGSRYEGSLGLLRRAAQARDRAADPASARDAAQGYDDRGSSRMRHPTRGPASTEGPGAGAQMADGDGGPKPASPTHGPFRVKTGLMAGLGETDEELKEAFREIRDAGVEVLTVGQYLRPTREHLPVDRFLTPPEFDALKEYALGLGFAHVESGPLVRSSYHAHEHRPDPAPLHLA